MTKIYYGCDHVPRGWGRYFALCNAVELKLSGYEKRPTTETLNRWRVDSPKGFAFVLHVDEAVSGGLVRLGDANKSELDDRVRKGWQSTLESAHALAARAIYLKTPLSFSPNPSNRALISAFAKELANTQKAVVIWESEGMWPVEDTRDFAESLGMAYAIDPFVAERDAIAMTHGDACFVLTERAGLRREFDAYDIELLQEWSQSYNRVFMLLRGRFQWKHARELHDALANH
ncbi:MAG: DUF72 domain-containing protein [Bradymonadaceae bacterium]|nr:DUF72 domain-containing protein [Lujinxingiaceae bacterium]